MTSRPAATCSADSLSSQTGSLPNATDSFWRRKGTDEFPLATGEFPLAMGAQEATPSRQTHIPVATAKAGKWFALHPPTQTHIPSASAKAEKCFALHPPTQTHIPSASAKAENALLCTPRHRHT